MDDRQKWPKWVPEPVRAAYTKLNSTFQPQIAQAERQLSKQRSTAAYDDPEVVARISHLKRLCKSFETIAGPSCHHRMLEVWVALSGTVATDTQWESFVVAAAAADQDYKDSRERKVRSQQLAATIAEQARELGETLAAAQFSGIYWPYQFTSVRCLLAGAKSNSQLWPVLSDHLLAKGMEPEGHLLRKAWAEAPTIEELLFALEASAKQFVPTVTGPAAAAATASREHNSRVGYIRALGNLLVENGLPVDQSMRKAMAVLVDIFLPDPNRACSEDEVRKALTNAKRLSENSPTKKPPSFH